MSKIAELENKNKLNRFKVQNGDRVVCTIEVWKNDRKAFSNQYEGNVTKVIEENRYCSLVKINNHDRMIFIEKILVGNMGGGK